jgi:hypothetical protein
VIKENQHARGPSAEAEADRDLERQMRSLRRSVPVDVGSMRYVVDGSASLKILEHG